jgi:predicted O-methyltransferase YrrM
LAGEKITSSTSKIIQEILITGKMYSKTQLALKYLHYYFTSSNSKGHGIHSPFLFELITEVLNDDRNFYAYFEIEAVRRSLLYDHRKLLIEDLGAGSRVMKNSRRSITSIASTSLKPKKFSQLLFRMVNHYQPQTILEIGTSLGITTAYLASAQPAAKVVTLEGSAGIISVAKENFARLNLQNIEIVPGNFDNTLSATIHRSRSIIDFAFIDGNHSYQPTIQYFREILSRSGNNSIIILDDIHWSKEMEQAWNEVQQHPSVKMTIDLFSIGIVFLREEFRVKQHFSIRF